MKSLTNRIDEHYRKNIFEGEENEKDDAIDDGKMKIHEAKINSEKEFREWAETVLKQAHGDNYDQAKADKVISDLVGGVQDGNWGEAVGRLTSGLN